MHTIRQTLQAWDLLNRRSAWVTAAENATTLRENLNMGQIPAHRWSPTDFHHSSTVNRVFVSHCWNSCCCYCSQIWDLSSRLFSHGKPSIVQTSVTCTLSDSSRESTSSSKFSYIWVIDGPHDNIVNFLPQRLTITCCLEHSSILQLKFYLPHITRQCKFVFPKLWLIT